MEIYPLFIDFNSHWRLSDCFETRQIAGRRRALISNTFCCRAPDLSVYFRILSASFRLSASSNLFQHLSGRFRHLRTQIAVWAPNSKRRFVLRSCVHDRLTVCVSFGNCTEASVRSAPAALSNGSAYPAVRDSR